jgi:hypothetical protein
MTTPTFTPPAKKEDTAKEVPKRVRTRLHEDVMHPQLVNSVPLDVSAEQLYYITRVLEVISSDGQFARKGLDALLYILSAPVGPSLTSLNPSQAALGSPSFTLHVMGTGFDSGSKIFWNGSEEITTFVSDTELTTEVDMSTAVVAVDIPVSVESGTGEVSNVMTFSLTAATVGTTQIKTAEVKK